MKYCSQMIWFIDIPHSFDFICACFWFPPQDFPTSLLSHMTVLVTSVLFVLSYFLCLPIAHHPSIWSHPHLQTSSTLSCPARPLHPANHIFSIIENHPHPKNSTPSSHNPPHHPPISLHPFSYPIAQSCPYSALLWHFTLTPCMRLCLPNFSIALEPPVLNCHHIASATMTLTLPWILFCCLLNPTIALLIPTFLLPGQSFHHSLNFSMLSGQPWPFPNHSLSCCATVIEQYLLQFPLSNCLGNPSTSTPTYRCCFSNPDSYPSADFTAAPPWPQDCFDNILLHHCLGNPSLLTSTFPCCLSNSNPCLITTSTALLTWPKDCLCIPISPIALAIIYLTNCCGHPHFPITSEIPSPQIPHFHAVLVTLTITPPQILQNCSLEPCIAWATTTSLLSWKPLHQSSHTSMLL